MSLTEVIEQIEETRRIQLSFAHGLKEDNYLEEYREVIAECSAYDYCLELLRKVDKC